MSYAGYNKFDHISCHFSFQAAHDGTCLVIAPDAGQSTTFLLEIPDSKGAQLDRLPLPEPLKNPLTAAAVFHAAHINNFIDRNGERQSSPFFTMPVRVGREAVWARRMD